MYRKSSQVSPVSDGNPSNTVRTRLSCHSCLLLSLRSAPPSPDETKIPNLVSTVYHAQVQLCAKLHGEASQHGGD